MISLDDCRKVVVIGAGPAGLTAAYELLARSGSFSVLVLEETGTVGGISRTVNYKGNWRDMGGHRLFSKMPAVNEWWEKMLPLQDAPAMDGLLLHRQVSCPHWGVQRIKGVIITAVMKNALLGSLLAKRRVVETSLIEEFTYPKFGPGQLWEVVADEIGNLGGTIQCNGHPC